MMRALVAVTILILAAGSAHAAKPSYFCVVTPEPTVSTPPVLALHVTGTVPNNADPYLRVDGSQEWTGLHNIKGQVDDWTGRVLEPGDHTAEIVDTRRSDLSVGFVYVIATCTFTAP